MFWLRNKNHFLLHTHTKIPDWKYLLLLVLLSLSITDNYGKECYFFFFIYFIFFFLGGRGGEGGGRMGSFGSVLTEFVAF